MLARRRSVSGESYNPEKDINDDVAVFPKTDAQRKRLQNSIQGILLFRSLDSEQLSRIIDVMSERKVNADEEVIRQGDDGDFFYVIDNGSFDVFVTRDNSAPRRLVNQLVDKGCFGELALMYNTPRSATVVAVTDGILWMMRRDAFRRTVLMSAYRKRKLYEELLASVPILASLEYYERMNLADALTSRTFTDSQCIIREGDDADGMFFVENGRVRVAIRKEGREKECARMSEGTYFGEMALVEKTPRSATVYALGTVKVAFLERDSFERLLGPCLDIMKRKMKSYEKSS